MSTKEDQMERRHASSGSPYEATIGFSRAVRLGNHIAVSGTAPIWPDGGIVLDAKAQAKRCLEIALSAVEELGGSVQDGCRIMDPGRPVANRWAGTGDQRP